MSPIATPSSPPSSSSPSSSKPLPGPPPAQIEYSSTAPLPASSVSTAHASSAPHAHVPSRGYVSNGDDVLVRGVDRLKVDDGQGKGGEGEGKSQVPIHLYERLPEHLMITPPGGGAKVPDYMRLILLSKVYSPPLNLAETPLQYAPGLSARLGNQIFLKREDMHPQVFSFKIRGAYNLMASLSEEERWRGVVTCSAGNHAQGVALAGAQLKIPCTIVMPVATPSIKWRNVERLGAKVILHGADFDAAKAECARLATAHNLLFVPPFDEPYIIAGQGTVAVELARQVKDFESLDGVFASVGGGGLISGMCEYIKRIAPPSLRVVGVETVDGDAMKRSLAKGERVVLDEVGPFSDGTAVRIVGEEPFRICKELLDDIVLVNNDEICAAVKDVFEESRSIPEPAGALALAGLKAHIVRNGLVGAGKRFVAVISGANMNFGRLRFVAERAELGERREVLMSVKIPEQPGAFVKLHSIIHPRATTEFVYRQSSSAEAYVIISFLLVSSPSSASGPSEAQRSKEVSELVASLKAQGMEGVDLSDDEFAKSHVRHMVGGKADVEDERLFRFEFPERPGALRKFLLGMQSDWSITLFHYRNHGSDVGKVLVGVKVPPAETGAWDEFLRDLGYPCIEETENLAYRHFLRR